MATIRKRGDYQWQAQIRLKGSPQVSMTFTHRSEAEQWVRKIEAEMDAGIYMDRSEADRTTLAVALDRYVDEVSSRKKGVATSAIAAKLNQSPNIPCRK